MAEKLDKYGFPVGMSAFERWMVACMVAIVVGGVALCWWSVKYRHDLDHRRDVEMLQRLKRITCFCDPGVIDG